MICHKLGDLSFLLKIIVNCFLDNVEEDMFLSIFLVVALVEIISVSLRTKTTFLLLPVGTNVIIMLLRFLYKEHLVKIFDIIGNITQF